MKRLLKWISGLLLLAAVLAAVFLLSLDSLLRMMMESRIRAETGMAVEIGKFHLGLLDPVVTIRDLKLHNPPAFGGTPFLNIPEIHVEYDRDALAKKQIHITLMRFNLGELTIVKNEAGQTNLFSLGLPMPTKDGKGGSRGLEEIRRRAGWDFKSIDVLNVSVGSTRFIDLKDPRNNREQQIGIDNLVIKNVQTPADLAGLSVLVALRAGDFFGSITGAGIHLQ